MELAWGSGSGEQARDQPEIVAGDMDEISLVEFWRPRSHVRRMPPARGSKRSCARPFGPQPDGFARHAGKQACAIVIDRRPRGMVALPAQIAFDSSLGDARLPGAVARCFKMARE